MIIVNRQVLHTGGGCMAVEFTVVDDSPLKSIVLGDNLVAGYNCEFTEVDSDKCILWSAYNYEELLQATNKEVTDYVLMNDTIEGVDFA